MAEGLGDLPEPTTEPPERFPGGADSIADEEQYGDFPDEPVTPDLQPEDNPAVDDGLPAEIAAPDDKPQAPEGKADDHESGTMADDGPEGEPDAGQEAEDGSPEPPA